MIRIKRKSTLMDEDMDVALAAKQPRVRRYVAVVVQLLTTGSYSTAERAGFSLSAAISEELILWYASPPPPSSTALICFPPVSV